MYQYFRKSSRSLSLLLGIFLLAGCAANTAYREGKGHDKEGREYEAATYYIKALNHRDSHSRAKKALGLIAADAYNEKLMSAEENEQTAQYPIALSDYKDLLSLVDRLERENMLTFSVIDSPAKIDEMENRAAEQEYALAETELTAKNWSASIQHYRMAQTFKETYKDCNNKMGIAYYRWAEDDLRAKEYRISAEHFAESADMKYTDASIRAGGLYAALAAFNYDKGHCRQSVLDYRSAGEHLSSEGIQTKLTESEKCAEMLLVIPPFENRTQTTVGGMELGSTLADAISQEIRDNSSEFVHIVDVQSLNNYMDQWGYDLSELISKTPDNMDVADFIAIGRINQISVERPDIHSTYKTVEGDSYYECTKTKSDGTHYKTVCSRAVTVAYREHNAEIRLRVAGTMHLYDTQRSRSLKTVNFTEKTGDSANSADRFTVNGVAVRLSGKSLAGTVGVPWEIFQLSQADLNLSSESELAHTIVTKLSRSSGLTILDQVDKEEQRVEPKNLVVMNLK